MGVQHRGLRRLMKGALRLVFPPQCLSCGTPVTEEGGLCALCWREADFIHGTCCTCCGAPLPDSGDADTEAGDLLSCDECLITPRPWQSGRAALVYRGTGRKLALMLKHGDRLDLAPALGGWLARTAEPLVQPGMVVVPVPVPLRRLLRRKYNQAEILARPVARAYGLDFLPGALRRLRHTPMQDHRSVTDRYANQKDAITAPTRIAQRLQGRPVLLVDDVMASGATLCAAATALNAAGAGPLSILVLARAVKDA